MMSTSNEEGESKQAALRPKEQLPAVDVDGCDVRALAPINDSVLALSSRQGLWMVGPEEESEEEEESHKNKDRQTQAQTHTPTRSLSLLLSKDSAGKQYDLSALAVSPDESRPFWLAALRQRSIVLWDYQSSQICGNLDIGDSRQRSLTDVDWATYLVSASMDGSVIVHDHRDLRKATATFNAKAYGHAQVRVNRQHATMVASAHAGNVHIWDLRNTKAPYSSIMAHVSNKIGKLDWHPFKWDELVTCSPSESEVKFWNVEMPQEEKMSLTLGSGVSCVKYVPSSEYIVTAHTDSRLKLSTVGFPDQSPGQVVATFGVGSLVDRRMDWVSLGSDEEESWQLVTVSGGSKGKVQWWHISRESALPEPSGESVTSRSDGEELMYVGKMEQELGLWEDQPLPYSDILVSHRAFDELDIRYGDTEYPTIHIRVNLPSRRSQKPPSVSSVLVPRGRGSRQMRSRIKKLFEGEADSLMTRISVVRELLEDCSSMIHELSTDSGSEDFGSEESDGMPQTELDPNAHKWQNTNYSLQPTSTQAEADEKIVASSELKGPFHPLHQLMLYNEMSRPARQEGLSQNRSPADLSLFGAGDSVPQPRGSGAVFSPTGVLWIFAGRGEAANAGQASSRWVDIAGSPTKGGVVVSGQFGMTTGSLNLTRDQSGLSSRLINRPTRQTAVMDLTLAKTMTVYVSARRAFVSACRENAEKARKVGRPEVEQTWQIATHAAVGAASVTEWNMHPQGRPLLAMLVEHHAAMEDIQTVSQLLCLFKAVLTCAFGPTASVESRKKGRSFLNAKRSQSGLFLASKGWVSLEETIANLVGIPEVVEVSSSRTPRYRFSVQWLAWAVRTYSEMVFGWELHDVRRELLRTLPQLRTAWGRASWLERWGEKAEAKVTIHYSHSRSDLGGSTPASQRRAVRCSVCRLPVIGLACSCQKCGHGGHASHLRSWFSKYTRCPTGCGCQCFFY